MKCNIYWIVILISSLSSLKAQDTHYWTQQFGTRSALMSGAVVAGADDNSMVYYNPGALGFLEDGNISINANLYQVENIRIENAIGQQTEFRSNQLGSIPILVSGMLNRENSKWKIGYGIMSPVAFQFKGTARLDGSFEISDDPESPGLEEFVGELSKNTKVTEIMAAIGFSRALNEKFSIGFTNLITVRSERFTRNFLAYYFLNDAGNTLVSGTDIENIKYYNVRFQLKLGAAWKLENNWEIGGTLTTPSINLFGNGTVAANLSLNNAKLFSDERDDFLATDRQEKLKSTFKSPFSFAIGVNKHYPKSTFAFTAQVFSGIDEYSIMEPDPNPFVRPSEVYDDFTSEEFLTVTTRARPVINVALAYERRINEMLTLNISARTDNSYFEDESRASVTTVSDWDLYHFTGGVNIEKERSSLTIGLLGSFGKNDEYLQDGNLDDPDDNLLFGGALRLAESRYTAIGILLGYTYRFRKFN